ncbi:MAG TPA: hypothetical protein VII63_12235 [Caulobacteraceae bacterium]
MNPCRSCVAGFVAVAILASGQAGAATRRIFSYDPGDDATRRAAGALTFEFDQKLLSTRVIRVRATEGAASAELKPARERALGSGNLSSLVAGGPAERDLYEVLPTDEGPAMMSAFCPGARRVWMDFGRLRANQDLRVYVFGGGATGTRLCKTFNFTFHGEWRLPPGPAMDPNRLPQPHFPY